MVRGHGLLVGQTSAHQPSGLLCCKGLHLVPFSVSSLLFPLLDLYLLVEWGHGRVSDRHDNIICTVLLCVSCYGVQHKIVVSMKFWPIQHNLNACSTKVKRLVVTCFQLLFRKASSFNYNFCREIYFFK